MTGRDDETEERGFLSRWSRMKRDAVRPAEPAPEEAAPPMPAEPAAEATVEEDVITEEEIAALPPVENVTDRAGLEPFFRKGVPAALRNAARRRMWMMNPKIADYLDVARDYAYDWNTPGGVPGSGGPLAPGMAAELVKNMISRGEWRKIGEEALAEDTAGAPGAGDERIAAAEETLEAEAVAEPEPTEAEGQSESLCEAADEPSRPPFVTPMKETSTFVQYADFGDQGAETEGAPPRRHGRATPR